MRYKRSDWLISWTTIVTDVIYYNLFPGDFLGYNWRKYDEIGENILLKVLLWKILEE